MGLPTADGCCGGSVLSHQPRIKEQPWPNEEPLGHQGGPGPLHSLCALESLRGVPMATRRSSERQRSRAAGVRPRLGPSQRRAPPGVRAARVPLRKGGSCGAAAGCGATSRGSLPGSAASGGRASVLRPQLERFPLITRRNASRKPAVTITKPLVCDLREWRKAGPSSPGCSTHAHAGARFRGPCLGQA